MSWFTERAQAQHEREAADARALSAAREMRWFLGQLAGCQGFRDRCSPEVLKVMDGILKKAEGKTEYVRRRK